MTDERAQSVIAVDPEHLRLAIEPLFAWLDASRDDEENTTLQPLDLVALIERFQSAFLLDKLTTVALFIRAAALSRFSTDCDLPSFLCEDSLPGRELCAAAAWLPLVEVPGEGDQEASYSFDLAQMWETLHLTGE